MGFSETGVIFGEDLVSQSSVEEGGKKSFLTVIICINVPRYAGCNVQMQLLRSGSKSEPVSGFIFIEPKCQTLINVKIVIRLNKPFERII